MKNIVAVHSNSFHGFSVEDALERIALSGFQYVELVFARGWTEHVTVDMDQERLGEIRSLMKSLGLSCPVLSGHCSLTNETRVEDFKKNIQLAHDLGCSYIVSSTGEAHYDPGAGQDEKLLVSNLRKLTPCLQAANLQLGIELHGEYGSGERLLPLLEQTNVPCIGMTYDTGNAVYYGRRAPEVDVKCCVDHIKTVHLKDKRGPDYIGIYPALGQGNLKLEAFIEYLCGHGFTGPISVEIEFDADFALRKKTRDDLKIVDDGLRESYRFLKRVGLIS